MGRVLGLDYGDTRIGLAMSDPNKIIASPLYTILNKGADKLKIKLEPIIIFTNVNYRISSSHPNTASTTQYY